MGNRWVRVPYILPIPGISKEPRRESFRTFTIFLLPIKLS